MNSSVNAKISFTDFKLYAYIGLNLKKLNLKSCKDFSKHMRSKKSFLIIAILMD